MLAERSRELSRAFRIIQLSADVRQGAACRAADLDRQLNDQSHLYQCPETFADANAVRPSHVHIRQRPVRAGVERDLRRDDNSDGGVRNTFGNS